MFGEIDGIDEGHEFKTRQEIYDAGLHRFTPLYTLAGMANLKLRLLLTGFSNLGSLRTGNIRWLPVSTDIVSLAIATTLVGS